MAAKSGMQTIRNEAGALAQTLPAAASVASAAMAASMHKGLAATNSTVKSDMQAMRATIAGHVEALPEEIAKATSRLGPLGRNMLGAIESSMIRTQIIAGATAQRLEGAFAS